MSQSEPQITEIAGVIADVLPTKGVPRDDAQQAWRHSIRYARNTGNIEAVTEQLSEEAPSLKPLWDELKS